MIAHKRFLQEARTIASLEHPHIVRIFDFGIQKEVPFLVMSYAPHGTLRQRHPKGSRVSLDDVLSYVPQIAPALQYAHDCKVIHRDVKPENMLLGSQREVLLSDFGIAVTTATSTSQQTKTTAGTVAYMAPEQIMGKPCYASDQYALGVVVYDMIRMGIAVTKRNFGQQLHILLFHCQAVHAKTTSKLSNRQRTRPRSRSKQFISFPALWIESYTPGIEP